MAALNTADNLPERHDYSVSHRPPPAIPTVPYSSLGTSDPTDSSSVSSKRIRQGNLGQFFRLHSSNNSVSGQSHSRQQSVATAPPNRPSISSPRTIPTTAAATVPAPPHDYANTYAPPSFSDTRRDSFSAIRKPSIGTNMLRKSSRLRRDEQERADAERKARMAAPPPSLPLHSTLPSIDTFGGDNNTSAAGDSTPPTSPSRMTNFSRPNVAMPASSTPASSSSPAYVPRSTNGDTGSVGRTESITNRGRYSYASSVVGGNVSSPRRIRRRKDPTPFNILVTGAKNSGKTSFISLIRNSMGTPSPSGSPALQNSAPQGTRSSFTSHYVETEIDGERIGLTLWDSVGLEKNIVDLQLREMTSFVESKFEDTFAEEQKVVRSPGVKDTHIHCVFLVLDPVRLDATVAVASGAYPNHGMALSVHGLEEDLDLQVLRALWGKTTVIPVIAKADTLTLGHTAFLKKAVWDSIKAAKLDPLEALELEDDLAEGDGDEDDSADETNGNVDDNGDVYNSNSSDSEPKITSKAKKAHYRTSSLTLPPIVSADEETPYIPMTIISPDPYDLPPYTKPLPANTKPNLTRRFAWGTADPFDATHCDYSRLRDSIFVEWRGELRDLSRSRWYENWRTLRLNQIPSGAGGNVGSGAKGLTQRAKGGVTPVAAVPREGLSSPRTARNFSPPTSATAQVPRVVAGPVEGSPPVAVNAPGNGAVELSG